jgi:hypothetical protein
LSFLGILRQVEELSTRLMTLEQLEQEYWDAACSTRMRSF